MIGIEDFSSQKDNTNDINLSMSSIAEKVELMNLLPMLLPDMKNINLKKKIDRTIIMSSQCSNLLS